MAKKLFGQSDKQYNKEYWGRLERNWRQWKGRQTRGRRTLETIQKKKEIKQKELEIQKWTKRIKIKWATWLIPTINHKILETRNLERGVVS